MCSEVNTSIPGALPFFKSQIHSWTRSTVIDLSSNSLPHTVNIVHKNYFLILYVSAPSKVHMLLERHLQICLLCPFHHSISWSSEQSVCRKTLTSRSSKSCPCFCTWGIVKTVRKVISTLFFFCPYRQFVGSFIFLHICKNSTLPRFT